MQPKDYEKYEKAKKRVKEIKGFYAHLRIFILVNLIIIIGRFVVLKYVISIEDQTADFLNWIDWNTFITPVLWGIGLLIHGLVVFNKKLRFFNKDWEEKKIREFMEEEENNRERWQ